MIRPYLSLALSGLCVAIGFAAIGLQAENKRSGENLDRCQEDIIRLKERNNIKEMLLSGSMQERGFEE